MTPDNSAERQFTRPQLELPGRRSMTSLTSIDSPAHGSATDAGTAGRSARPLRVLVITPIPTPYRDPFWTQVSRRPELDLEVLYCSTGKSDRPWQATWETGFQQHFPRSYNLVKRFGEGASCFWNSGTIKLLREQQYDAILIGGYNHLTMLAAIAYARLTGTPYLLMNEVYLRQPRSRWRKVLKEPLVRSVVGKAAGCLPTGTLATEYLRHYGAREEGLCRVPNVPDVELFRRRARELLPRRDELREQKGLGTGPVVVFVSRLIGLKRVDLLLDAACDVLRERDLKVVILGDGPKRTEWEQHAVKLGIRNRVHFQGFIAPGDLPEWYAVSDLFVLPSTDETWSVVVLESLASGVPVIITDLVGCCADVINDPLVGTVVPAGESAPIAAAMRRHLANPVAKTDVIAAWEPVFEQLRYEVIAERLSAHLHEICSQRGGDAAGS